MMPVVLAHSGLATTDIIFTSFFLTAVYAFTRWLEAPSLRTAVVFGFAVGLSAASKFSTLVYLPVIIGLTLLLYFASKRQPASTGELPDRDRRWGPRNVAGLLRTTAIVLVCAFVVIWASYRFSHAPLNSLSSAPDHVADKAFGSSSSVARRVHVLTSKLQIPASEYYGGIRFLRDQNRLGRRSYLFGKMKEGGWWYFYIVSLGLKTPISALLLAIVGGASLAVTWSRSRVNWQQLVPLAGAVALIIATIPSRINIGVRHVMPIFGFLSMLAAWGVVALWNAGSDSSQDSPLKSGPAVWVRRVCAVVLVVWLVVSSVRSHPDYLSYFNEFGGSHPENLLIISDVDWGQDLTRLSTYLKKQQAEQVSILYVVVFDAPSLGLPPTVHLHCGETATGWVAIEERYARVYPECAQWIAAQPVHAEVGKTMRVYYLPRPEVSQP
jgi:hypothetical protein